MTVPKAPAAHTQRVAIIAGDAGNVLRNRIELIRRITAARHQVTVLVPSMTSAEAAVAVEVQASVAFRIEAFGDGGASFRPQATTEKALASRLRALAPHVALVTADVLSPAVRACRTDGAMRVVAHVNRLDAIMPDDRSPGWLAGRRLRQALAAVDALVCHNREDARRVTALDALPTGAPVTIVPGAGIDLERFAAAPLPVLDGGITVLMVARFDRRSGVLDYCEAARRLVARHPGMRFLLSGHEMRSTDGLDPQGLTRRYPFVEIVPPDADIAALLASAHLYVQATWGEGMPRSLLAAAARGRPIVATDTPGCRDCVDERVNGVLAPPRDPDRLAEAIESVLKRPDLLPAMARASRHKAERRFDVHKVTAELVRVLGLER